MINLIHCDMEGRIYIILPMSTRLSDYRGCRAAMVLVADEWAIYIAKQNAVYVLLSKFTQCISTYTLFPSIRGNEFLY